MERAQKESLVSSLRQTFDDTTLVVVTHQTGLNVAEATDLRRQMRKAGATFRVTKNRLARLALKDSKLSDLADLAELFTGPTAIATSTDPVAAAKVAVDFAKDNEKLIVVGGALNAESLDAGAVKALAALPSLDELRAKIVGMLQTPAQRLVMLLQAPAGQVARVVRAYSDAGGGPPLAAEETPGEPEPAETAEASEAGEETPPAPDQGSEDTADADTADTDTAETSPDSDETT